MRATTQRDRLAYRSPQVELRRVPFEHVGSMLPSSISLGSIVWSVLIQTNLGRRITTWGRIACAGGNARYPVLGKAQVPHIS
jgi:hypothetical protein